MLGRLKSFKDYCDKNGIQILKDDLTFIDRILNNIHKTHFKAVLVDYLKEWSKGMGMTEKVQQKQNLGRRRANLWLLAKSNGNETQKD